ncbi:MAG: hypothetical protein ACAI44_13145 [Candidatus Sericytochromatia bacterium]
MGSVGPVAGSQYLVRPDGQKLGATHGTSVRITPQNYRQVLGANADVLMTPQNTKDLFEKGYLDVKRTFTEDTSSEGALTLIAKSLGAILGPSRSLAAITLDPKFMQMIKDPSSEIGFGTTKVRAETMEVLPSPAEDPPPPAEGPGPEAPEFSPPIRPDDPQQHERTRERPRTQTWDPVKMAQVNPLTDPPPPGDVHAYGLFIHDSAVRRPETERIVKALSSAEDGTFELTGNVNSNILRPTGDPHYNDGLSTRRAQGLPPGWERNPNSDHLHRDALLRDFHLQTSTSGPPAVHLSPPSTAPADTAFEAAANKLITYTGGQARTVLQSDTDITRPNTRIEHVIDDVTNAQRPRLHGEAKEAFKAGLREKLYPYAQSFVEHRRFDMQVHISDYKKAEKWLGQHPELANTQVFKDVKEQVRIYNEGQTGSTGIVEHNVDSLTQPGPPEVTVTQAQVGEVKDQIQSIRDSHDPKLIEANREQLGPDDKRLLDKLNTLEGRLTALETAHPDLPTGLGSDEAGEETALQENLTRLAKPGMKPEDVAEAKAFITQQIQDSGSETTSEEFTLGDKTYPAGTKWTDILTDATAIAEQSPGVEVIPGAAQYDKDEVAAAVSNDLEALTGFKEKIAKKEYVNPQSITNYIEGAQRHIDLLKLTDPNMDVGPLQAQLDAFKNDPAIKEYQRAAAISGNTGTYDLATVNKSINDFQAYVKSSIADGKITHTEQQNLQGFVDKTAKNLALYLGSKGVPGFENIDQLSPADIKSKLASLDVQALMASPSTLTAVEADELVQTIEKVTTAQASMNVATAEGGFTTSLYQNVRILNQRLDEFNNVEVVKTAFKNEMKGMASQEPPVAFNTLLEVAYGLPHLDDSSPQPVKDAYAHLQEQAKNGTLAFPPNIGFVDRAQLGGGNAAYVRDARDPDNPSRSSGPTILLSRDLLSQPAKLMDVFKEEMFHHLEHSADVQALEALNVSHGQRIESAEETLGGSELALTTARDTTRAAFGITSEIMPNKLPDNIPDVAKLTQALDTLRGSDDFKNAAPDRQAAMLREAVGTVINPAALTSGNMEALLTGLNNKNPETSTASLVQGVKTNMVTNYGGKIQDIVTKQLKVNQDTRDLHVLEAAKSPALKDKYVAEARGVVDDLGVRLRQELTAQGEAASPKKIYEPPLLKPDGTINLAATLPPAADNDNDKVKELRGLHTDAGKHLDDLQTARVKPDERIPVSHTQGVNHAMKRVATAQTRVTEAAAKVQILAASGPAKAPELAVAVAELTKRQAELKTKQVELRTLEAAGDPAKKTAYIAEAQGNLATADRELRVALTEAGKAATPPTDPGLLDPVSGNPTSASIPPAGKDEPQVVKDARAKHSEVSRELRGYQTAALDAHGDEGRRALEALRVYRSQGTNVDAMRAAADRGGVEQANVSGNVTRDSELFDQGVTGQGGITVNGQQIVGAGQHLEFSSDPDAGPPPLPGHGQGNGAIRDSSQQRQQGQMVDYSGTGHQPIQALNPNASQARPMQEVPQRGAFAGSSQWDDHFAQMDPNQTVSTTNDSEKGTGAKIAEMMMDAVPRGLQAVGKMLVNFSEELDRVIQKYFKDIGKPTTRAEEVIYGGAGPRDRDLALGRPDDYAKTTTPSMEDSRNLQGPPDYALADQQSKQANAQQRAASELQREQMRQRSYFEKG